MPFLEASTFGTEHPVVFPLFPELPRIHHFTCLLPCPLQALIISCLYGHSSLPTGFSAYGVSSVEFSRTSAPREPAKSQLQPRPSLSLQPLMTHVAQGMPSPFISLTFIRFGGVNIHPSPSPFSGVALTVSYECRDSSKMVRVEPRIQILITTFLVYFTAFLLTRQF